MNWTMLGGGFLAYLDLGGDALGQVDVQLFAILAQGFIITM